MKKRFSICLLGLFLLGSLASLAPAQTAKEILEKMIDAQGGRTVLESLKDTTISGTIEMITMGFSGTITMYQKEPNKMRMEMEFMGMAITQAFDGEIGWTSNPQTGTMQLSGKQNEAMMRQALGNDATLNPEKYGLTFAFKGQEKIQDKEYLVLEQTYKDGEKVTMYVDPATYLIYRTKGKALDQMGGEVDSESVFSDYRKVGNTVVAHAITIFQSGAEFLKMSFSKVDYNTGLQDSMFKMTR
jgi:outer membrane lipoprotein-sorting protein